MFCTIAVFSLNGEYVVRSFLPNGVFLPCEHGLAEFLTSAYVRIQSINKKSDSSVLVFTYVFVCIVTAVCIVVVYVPSIISSSALLVVSMKELVVIFTYVFECF